jgi:hypothetical protein
MTRISSGYSAYSVEALAQLFSIRSNSQTTASLSSGKSQLLRSQSQNSVVNAIEKHISDVKKGQGDISKNVAYSLGQQSSNASDILSKTNPKALSAYSGYLSGLRYDRAARFVNGVEYGLSTISTVEGVIG